MRELTKVHRYAYWSDRRIKEIAADNNMDLDRRWRLGLKTPALGLLPQADITKERRAVQRHDVALRVEKAIGQLAVEDFVSPLPASYAKGCTDITFAAYTRWYGHKKEAKRRALILHARTESSDGTRVELCFFASIENCAGYLAGNEAQASMWSSSSTGVIEEFIGNKGKQKAKLYDDDESIAVEILRTVYNQGMTDQQVFKRLPSAEWFAEVYHDVELDKSRWHFRPGVDFPKPVDRIVIAAPLWVRSNYR